MHLYYVVYRNYLLNVIAIVPFFSGEYHVDNVRSLCLSSGRLLATGDEDCNIRMWSLDKPNCVLVSGLDGSFTSFLTTCTKSVLSYFSVIHNSAVYVQNFQPVICSIYNDCGNSLTCSYKTGSLCDLITSFCRILLIKCSSVCTGMCNMCIASTHTVSLSPLLIQCTEFLLGTKN